GPAPPRRDAPRRGGPHQGHAGGQRIAAPHQPAHPRAARRGEIAVSRRACPPFFVRPNGGGQARRPNRGTIPMKRILPLLLLGLAATWGYAQQPDPKKFYETKKDH